MRKLEYLAADALAQGCDTLVSIGGIQSNHTRQVTGVARHLGLKVVTVQEGWVDWPDVVYDKVGNIQLTRIMGGDVRIDPAGFDIGYRDSWKRAIDSVVEAGGTPYPIPAGASDHPLGGLGFANWAREVAAQEAERDIFFDHIVVCTVTGSTHAGMIAGSALEHRGDRRVIGIDASKTLEQTRSRSADRCRDRGAIGVDRALRADEITLVAGYAGPAYGMPDEQTVEAIHLAARTEGMLTDPVYEGKSMAGLIGMIRSGEIPPGSRVLYAHLGGQPALLGLRRGARLGLSGSCGPRSGTGSVVATNGPSASIRSCRAAQRRSRCSLDGEAGHHPDHLAQEVDDGADVEELGAQALAPQIDDLQPCGLGAGAASSGWRRAHLLGLRARGSTRRARTRSPARPAATR